MRLLAVSPVPSHPQWQGNSSRIFALLRQCQARGHQVHLLYYALEGLDEAQASAMARSWDGFQPVPCTAGPRSAPPPGGWGVDDWFQPELGRAAAELHGRWQFDAVLVNYVWMSRVLEYLPADLPSAIDTHDVFGRRDEVFSGQGLAPAWFFTSVDEELRGLRRADVVVAIQPDEARYFEGQLERTSTRVMTVGHLLPGRPLARPDAGNRLRAGYLASANPLNVQSARRLMEALERRPDLADRLEIVIGGPVSPHVKDEWAGCTTRLGIVDDLASFYQRVDCCVNPMVGGTGLKIKTLEALSFGRAIVGTDSAWAGLPPPPSMLASTPDALVAALAEMTDPQKLADATRAGAQLFARYVARESRAVDGLMAALRCNDNADREHRA